MHDLIVTAVALGGYFCFSAAVGAMLPPLPGGERSFYGWLYRFAQILAANAARLYDARYAARFGQQVGDTVKAAAGEPGTTTLAVSEEVRTAVASVQR